MATQEKLIKSLESLKSMVHAKQGVDSSFRKKDKIQHCNVVVEAMANPAIKIAPNLHSLLRFSIEMLLQVCDDPDSDVRMAAEESLNRLIRSTCNRHMHKILVELHEEIKSNGSARILKAALSRFAELSHNIQPRKGKIYATRLMPCLTKIAAREEESIQETLASQLPKIMKALGCFVNDNDIKSMLKEFINNLQNPSAAIRRSGATCILAICLNCRKSFVFLTYVLNSVLDLVIPVQEAHSLSLILGVFGCLKLVLPYIKNSDGEHELKGSFGVKMEISEVIFSVEKLLQVYELCLHYLTVNDHNVINASLETLNIILQNIPEELKAILLSRKGVGQSKIFTGTIAKMKSKSPSQLSVATTCLSNEENLESDLLDSVQPDIQKWLDESKLSVMNVTYARDTIAHPLMQPVCKNEDDADACDYSNIAITADYSESVREEKSIVESLERVHLSETSSEKSFTQLTEDGSVDIIYQDVNIGEFTTDDVNLLYCTRLIVKSFLLTGSPNGTIPDKVVRVTVKSLALAALATIFQIYPEAFLKHLNRTGEARSNQPIWDILLYGKHADPQLRGTVRILIGKFIKSVLIRGGGDYDRWISENAVEENVLSISHLIKLIIQGLEDESSNCTRQTLQSLTVCFNPLLQSSQSAHTKLLLEILPAIASNPYWLVKVKLLEVIGVIDYLNVYYITGASEFQEKILNNVIYVLIGSADQRVRTACCSSLISLVRKLYYKQNNPNEMCVTSKAKFHERQFFSGLLNVDIEVNQSDLPAFATNESDSKKLEEHSLSRIVFKLTQLLIVATSKHAIQGCFEALSDLSQSYPPVSYCDAWGCFPAFNAAKCAPLKGEQDIWVNSSAGLLAICINLLNNGDIAYDLNCHLNILKLIGNLFMGVSVYNLKEKVNYSLDDAQQLWDMYTDRHLSLLTEQFLLHILKLLNVFFYIIEDMSPIMPQSKPVLSNLPTPSALSPMKRRKSDANEKGKHILTNKEKEERFERKLEFAKGFFLASPHYMKIYNMLKASYVNYKITLELDSCGFFFEFLRAALAALSNIMEFATLCESGRIAEEILNYLLATFSVEPHVTVVCLQQLLKSLFGTNSTYNSVKPTPSKKGSEPNANLFYHAILQKSYKEIATFMHNFSHPNKIEKGDQTVMGYFHRKPSRRLSTLPRGGDKLLANYIQLFEPIIIEALSQYTTTSDVQLQSAVLKLLYQLIQLGINYCLLDGEQVFVKFVLKQFEFIETGQLPSAHVLIPNLFDFLVQLSYSQQHSKSIMEVPKIVQLCDGLMASGQPPLTHCIPALQPVVEDIFLYRTRSSRTNLNELETTQEVVFAMLLRLLEYCEIIELIVVILSESKVNEEKWRRWSHSVIGIYLPLIKGNRIDLNNERALNATVKLFFTLNPGVFKSLTDFLSLLFDSPPPQDVGSNRVTRWLGKVIATVLIILRAREDHLLREIGESKQYFATDSIFENVKSIKDPLNVINATDFFRNIPSEVILIRLLFRIIEIVSRTCIANLRNEEDQFLMKMFSNYLMICLHILQAGSHRKLTNAAISLINQNEDGIPINAINANFLQLAAFYPTVTFKWCYILTLLNYSDVDFWANIMKFDEISASTRVLQCNSINLDILRVGGTIVFCDYLTVNANDDLQMWILKNIVLLIDLCDEEPIYELFTSLHRNSYSSQLVVTAINDHCLSIIEPAFRAKLLKSVDNVHPSQIGNLLALLLPQFLDCRQLALSRLASNLASRKTELLLTMSMEEVNGQLSRDRLIKIMHGLVETGLHKKHEALISLLNKLATQYYDLSPLEFYQRRTVNPEYIKKLTINKIWYISQIKAKCQNLHVGHEVSQLLHHLNYPDTFELISDREFDTTLLSECIALGISKMKDNDAESNLLRASVEVLMKHVQEIRNLFPKPHQVYSVRGRLETPSESKYFHALRHLFDTQQFWLHLSDLIPCVTLFLDSLKSHPSITIPDGNFEDFIRFAVVCFESLNYLIDSDRMGANINYVDMAVTCIDVTFKENALCSILALDTHLTWLCSAINCLYKLTAFLLLDDEPLPSIPKYGLDATLDNLETTSAGHACHQLYTLVCWMEKVQNERVAIPIFLLNSIKSIVVALSRLPLVNSYLLTPPAAWKSGLSVPLFGSFNTHVPLLPIEYLKETDILEEFIFRITLFGWRNRQQFEETWMCLLSVLCTTPTEEMLSHEMQAMFYATSLSIKAITALLLQTLHAPHLGNPNVSHLVHVSRDPQITTNKPSTRMLKQVQESLVNKYNGYARLLKNADSLVNAFDKTNLERIVPGYGYGQVSIEYLLNNGEKRDSCAAHMRNNRQRLLEESGLDVNSCLQFLIDMYSQWLTSATTPIIILYEVVKSVLVISDLFTEKGQFNWMLDAFIELSRNHTIEDEILHQYIGVGLCKAAAVLTPNTDIYEIIRKTIATNLKSSFIPSRIASLYGLLYLIEGGVLGNTHIGGLSDEMQLIVPFAIEYINCNIHGNYSILSRSQEHNMAIWALTFYLIENVELNLFDADFIPNVIKSVKGYLSQVKISAIQGAIMKGLERLVIKKRLAKPQLYELIKLSLEKLHSCNSKCVIHAIQLLLTCSYTDYAEHLNSDALHTVSENNPDTLVQSIERISVLFDYVRKGYPFDVEVICSVLPDVLNDFFSPSDILTKVLGEFLSPQQPHPKLLSRVVFKVFECAIKQSQLSLLQDWVVFNLTSFTQFSVGMATWYLTCFFISASTNEWLRALFPYVQSRIGRYDYEDRQLLCIAGADFYRNLEDEGQRTAFVETFTKARNQSEMPYADLLLSI